MGLELIYACVTDFIINVYLKVSIRFLCPQLSVRPHCDHGLKGHWSVSKTTNHTYYWVSEYCLTLGVVLI